MTIDQAKRMSDKYDAIMAYIEFMPVSRIMKVKLIDAVDDLISLYIKELGEDLDFSNGGK